MVKYIIQCETGLQGLSYYHTRYEAMEAARRRELYTGLKWIVREIIVR